MALRRVYIEGVLRDDKRRIHHKYIDFISFISYGKDEKAGTKSDVRNYKHGKVMLFYYKMK